MTQHILYVDGEFVKNEDGRTVRHMTSEEVMDYLSLNFFNVATIYKLQTAEVLRK
jgi:hypothetical protein